MPRYRIEFSPLAKSQLRLAIAWWRKHRPEAPDLLGLTVRAAIAALREAPAIGVIHVQRGIAGVRRLPLQRTPHVFFYRVDPDLHVVHIVAVWHASRGKGPPLK